MEMDAVIPPKEEKEIEGVRKACKIAKEVLEYSSTLVSVSLLFAHRRYV